MREIDASFLRDEIFRLGSVALQAKMFHPSGEKIHSVHDVLTLEHAKLMQEVGIQKVFLLEPAEDEIEVQRKLQSEWVPLSDLRAGDVLTQDVRRPGGALILAAGKGLGGDTIEAVRAAGVKEVSVRRRVLEAELLQVREYASRRPRSQAILPRSDTRATRITRVANVNVRPFLIPSARVLVAVKDDFSRDLISNMLVSAGHEVVQSVVPEAALQTAERVLPEVVILDSEAGHTVGADLRRAPVLRGLMILARLDGETPGAIYQALSWGANDAFGMPPRRDVLVDKLRACLEIRGRRVRLPTCITLERRQHLREGVGKARCHLSAPFAKKPLPIAVAEVLDWSPGGVLIEFNLPAWPNPWAYEPHGVHPKHYWFGHAKGNPLGQPLSVVMTGATGPMKTTVEVQARVVCADSRSDSTGKYERARLSFDKRL